MQNNRISCYLLALWKPARLHHQMKTMYLTVEVHCHNNPDPTSSTFRAEGWPTLKFPCPGLSSFLQVIPTSHMKTLWSATRRSCSSWPNRASNLCWFSIVLRYQNSSEPDMEAGESITGADVWAVCRICFSTFGDLVDTFITFSHLHELHEVQLQNAVQSHANVYKVYHQMFKGKTLVY